MTPAAIRAHALAKPGSWVDTPWEDDEVVKVGPEQGGKIFVFLGSGSGGGGSIGIKAAAGREAADEWLLRYPGAATVMPYIGRSGWNTLALDGRIPDDELLAAIDTSYALVVSGLPRSKRPAAWDA
jgi:predicted DNA-binding protein (MmcQ/YjbR family)